MRSLTRLFQVEYHSPNGNFVGDLKIHLLVRYGQNNKLKHHLVSYFPLET